MLLPPFVTSPRRQYRTARTRPERVALSRPLSCSSHPVPPRTIQVQASNPMEEDKVSISTVLRQAVSVEISLSNPLNEELRFLVSLQVS